MRKWRLNLRLFDGGAGAAAGAEGGDAGNSAVGTPAEATGQGVQVLPDGTQMDHRLAERMEKQRKRRNETGTAGMATGGPETGTSTAGDAMSGGQAPGDGHAAGTKPAQAQNAKTPEEEFDELIHGKYSQQYQQRFQNAISERFKNQADLQGQLNGLKPMLDALAKQHGIEAGDYQALSNAILDDDSLYEDEAEAAGMTVEAYKSYKKLKAHADEMDQRAEQSRQESEIRQHLQGLARAGEQLKQKFPDFDLMKELQNPAFRRMTAPNSGLTVEQAYYAVHYNELAPQIMAAGVRTAQQRIAQSMQTNSARPMEGAMQGNNTAADIHIDPRTMTREQREAIKARVRRGETVTL